MLGCACLWLPIRRICIAPQHFNNASAEFAINNCIKHGELKHALLLFDTLQDESVKLSEHTLVALLKATGKLKDLVRASNLHGNALRRGLLNTNIFIGSGLIDVYAKCGAVAEAQQVFDMLQSRDVVTWTSLIGAYAQHGQGSEALDCFDNMRIEGVSPNAVTFICSLKACANVGALDKGEEIHAEVVDKGFLEKNTFLANALIDMYSKCGSLYKAQVLFDELPCHDAACWNSLITGYAQHDQGEEALHHSRQMQLCGFSPDAITFASSLKACGSIRAIDHGRALHMEIVRKGLLVRNIVLSNALVDMYAKCGILDIANEVLYGIEVRNVISWTALITGYTEHEHSEEALACFIQMKSEGISPNAFTFTCALKACGSLGATDKANKIHFEVSRLGLLRNDIVIGNALIDAYCKCGMPAEAQKVLNKFSIHSVVTWSALVAGYAQLGDYYKTLQVFDRMSNGGNKANAITFVSVFNACSHAGFVDEGWAYFNAMRQDLGIAPTLDHHLCMVDLFSRAGQLGNAFAVVGRMPYHPNNLMWLNLLGACRKWCDVELGSLAFEQAVVLDDKDASAYICMYNIFRDAGIEAVRVDAMRVKQS